MTEAQAQAVQQAYAESERVPLLRTLPLGPGVEIALVLIPPGEFMMGVQGDAFSRYISWAPEDDRGRANTMHPHRVQVSQAFYMGRTAVTQAQWQAVTGSNPAHFGGDGQLPIENISALECDAFCRALSSATGQAVRLPSEAEWEYACRAGSPTLFHFGDSLEELDQYGWYRGNSGMRSHPVGLKRPNPWGLYDMHGGIDEFCQDPEHGDYSGAPYGENAWLADGDMSMRVKRGASWYDHGLYCTSPHHSCYPVDTGSEDHGLRVVMNLGHRARTILAS